MTDMNSVLTYEEEHRIGVFAPEYEHEKEKNNQNELPVAFNKKNDLHTKWDFFKQPFRIIGLIHEFGNVKYAKYSWCNDPENSFSTVASSIGSILNHYILYKTGCLYDSESGYSHLGHLCVRAQMTIGPYYRTNSNHEYFQPIQDARIELNELNIRHKLNKLEDETFLTDQLAIETVLSAMKFNPTKFVKTVNDAELLLWHHALILNGNAEISERTQDIWNTVLPIDLIFWSACLLYNNFLQTNEERAFVPKEIKSGWK